MCYGRTWIFHIPETYNKDLPADLKPVATFCTWRVSDVAHGSFSLFGLVELKEPARRPFLRAYFPTAHLTLSSQSESGADFYPLYGGHVITFGVPSPYKRGEQPNSFPIKRIKTNGSLKKLKEAASATNQTQISLSRLAASEMGFEL